MRYLAASVDSRKPGEYRDAVGVLKSRNPDDPDVDLPVAPTHAVADTALPATETACGLSLEGERIQVFDRLFNEPNPGKCGSCIDAIGEDPRP